MSARRPLRAGLLAVAVALGVAALPAGSAAAAGPAVSARPAHPGGHARPVTVMSYNLYLGANLQPLFGATPQTLPGLAQDVWDHVERVDFRQRARAIARLVDDAHPDVVGLQEVALWERGATAETLAPVYDFQQILLDALAARGEHYRAVSTSRNFASPPVPLAGGGVARFTDRDVVLVRRGVVARDAADGRFLARVPLPGPLFAGLSIVRGWASVDVSVQGQRLRVVDTHLEAYSAEVRALQAAELAGRLAPTTLALVLVGDLNSRPDDATGAYGILRGTLGLRDAWTEVHGPEGGFTSGQTDDLNLPESRLDHRIDYVLFRGLRATGADVVGEQQCDRTPPLPGAPYGLWPSDHAGVVAAFSRRGR